MKALKGDFISFSFNGVHSSDLGVTRTSDGSRYNENLLPTIQDKTVQVPGADGTYFFGSFYMQRQFNVPIAFDKLTEEKYRKLRQHFGSKGIHELIFDERPYKVYMAKSTGTPQLKTICFDGEDEEGNPCRIYKGEGTLNFVCYYPFARSRFKYLENYTSENISEWVDWPGNFVDDGIIDNKRDLYYLGALTVLDNGNLSEWLESSGVRYQNGLKDEENNWIYEPFDKIEPSLEYENSSEINLYNPGDIETDLKVYFDFSSYYIETKDIYVSLDKSYYIKGEEGQEEYVLVNIASFEEGVQYYEKVWGVKLAEIHIVGNGSLTFKEDILRKNDKDYAICINSKTNLIEGVMKDEEGNYISTGTLYNEYMETGTFFKVPLGNSIFKSIGAVVSKIEYNYIYY